MKGLGFILFIIAVQAISALIQYRKKQQERKAREEAIRQRGMTQPSAQATPGPVAATPPPNLQPVPLGTPVATSAAALEARRKAQLEQLKQRRDNRRTAIPTPPSVPATLSIGKPANPIVPGAGSKAFTVAAQTFGMSDQARSRAQEAERRSKEQEKQRRAAQGRAMAQRGAIEDKANRRSYEAEFESVTSGPAQAAAPASAGGSIGDRLTPRTEGGSAAATALIRRLRDRTSLRELVVIREVLDKPLSLREQG